MIRVKLISSVMVSLSILVAGCDTFRGPPPIIEGTGPTITEPTDGLAKKFLTSATAAYSNDASARAMLDDGYSLVYTNCSAYFRDAGRTQQILIVFRDFLGTVGTLTTGVIAIAHASKDVTAIAALVTAGGYSAADNIAKEFLFSAENIDSVRELTLTKMADFYNKIPADKITYNSASRYLTDIQNYCSLRKIASLAKDAISAASNAGAGAGLSAQVPTLGIQAPLPPPPPPPAPAPGPMPLSTPRPMEVAPAPGGLSTPAPR